MSDAALALGDNSTAVLDIERVRGDFPILSQQVYGKPLVYLDNAASVQKPRQVLEAMQEAYETYYANVHRGLHKLSQTSTDAFEAGREKIARFINAPSMDEIIFTRGTTEAINLVAASYGRSFLRAGDEVILSQSEHHSNIVPWQLLRDEKGIVIKVVPVDDDGSFMLDEYQALLSDRTRLVAVQHISNAMGTVNPVKEIVRLAHQRDIPVLIDGAQGAAHARVDVRDLDADFYALSSHKMYGPTGMGALYGRMDLLKRMPPYHGGGEMISSVTFEKSTFKAPPHRFEAGTPAIVEAIGMGAAADYVTALGHETIAAHEHGLLVYATERLSKVPGLRIIGTARDKVAIISFDLEGVHAHDVGTIVDRAGVAVRAGHHCAQPLMERFGVTATTRASFALYNTRQEVDALVDALKVVTELFG